MSNKEIVGVTREEEILQLKLELAFQEGRHQGLLDALNDVNKQLSILKKIVKSYE